MTTYIYTQSHQTLLSYAASDAYEVICNITNNYIAMQSEVPFQNISPSPAAGMSL